MRLWSHADADGDVCFEFELELELNNLSLSFDFSWEMPTWNEIVIWERVAAVAQSEQVHGIIAANGSSNTDSLHAIIVADQTQHLI